MTGLDLTRNSAPLAVLRLIDLIVLILTHERLIRRHLNYAELVDLHELGRLGQCGTGHPRKLVVEAEEVLQRDRGQRLVLFLDANALLRLNRLVQPFRPAAPFKDAAGELVDDPHFAVDHGVVNVALVKTLRLKRLNQVVDERPVLGPVEVVNVHELLCLTDAALGDCDGLVLLIELVVEVGDEIFLRARIHPLRRLTGDHLRRELCELAVGVGGGLGRAGDDQRRTRLVDQNVVDLIDDRKVVHCDRPTVLADPATVLNLLLKRLCHVVAQIIEAELGVRAVCDVIGVSG